LKAENVKQAVYVSTGGSESDVIAKYEIMDGRPVRGDRHVVVD